MKVYDICLFGEDKPIATHIDVESEFWDLMFMFDRDLAYSNTIQDESLVWA